MSDFPDLDETVQRIVAAELEGEQAEQGMAVTEWVLIAGLAGWTGDGSPVSQVVIVPSDAPAHRLWGLVRDADVRFAADTLEGYRAAGD